MNPENVIGNLGIALGLLDQRGYCYARIDGEDVYFAAYIVPGTGWMITTGDALRLMSAEEIW